MFNARVARETGAVVVSITYRFAPEYTFPAAIDDVDDTIKWIQENAESRWGADPTMMTLSGASSGANLSIASTVQPNCQPPAPTAPKAIVAFDAAIDLRLTPAEKPRPEGFPKSEPLKVLYPLFDAYATEAREAHLNNPRLSPALSKREHLPDRMLFIIAGMDIVVAEQLEFARRINEEDDSHGPRETPRIETMVVEGMPHGYIEREFLLCSISSKLHGLFTCMLTLTYAVPDIVVKPEIKERSLTRGVQYLSETYSLHGWTWQE